MRGFDIMDAVGPGLPSQPYVWKRHPVRDIPGDGKKHAGDCWINQHGDIRYTLPGFDLNAPGNEAIRDDF